MTTYEVTPELAGLSTKRLVLAGIVTGVIYISGLFVCRMLWASPGRPLQQQVVDLIVQGIGFPSVMVFLMWLEYNFALEVSDGSITMRRIFFTSTIRRGEIKAVVETRPRLLAPAGLRISKHGRFGTRFLGCIWIPKSLPQYQQIRSLVESWKSTP